MSNYRTDATSSLFCTYTYQVGWRVVGSSDVPQSIGVISRDGVKLLRIPSVSLVPHGWFANPRVLVGKLPLMVEHAVP